jgi:ABC-type phosphate/phosphonate transport system substrate-binding protein
MVGRDNPRALAVDHRQDILRASLPMYNIPEMRQAFRQFWAVLRQAALRRGLDHLPADLDISAPAVPDRIGGEVVFSQVCGFPLLTRLRGQAQILLTPIYDAPGCDGPTHTAFFIVRADARFQRLEDLRGCAIAVNSLLSNSGMNLPRRSIADIARGRPFFGSVLMTGSHTASIEKIASGEADVASIDCVTDAVFRRYRPAIMDGIRILASSVPSPALPFVTSSSTDERAAAILRECLASMPGNREGREACAGILIRGFAALGESDYRAILHHQDEAARLGYPELR